MRFVTVSISLSLVVLIQACASTAERPAADRWHVDANGDGVISQAEASESMPGLAQRFSEFDANGDGKISRDEIHDFGGQR